MKNLAAIALVALTLTGCGAQLAPVSTAAPSAVTASAKRDELQLYGSFIRGKVLAAKTLTQQDENGKAFEFQELTVDARPRKGELGERGKIVFRVITGNPLAKVGQTVDTFVNY